MGSRRSSGYGKFIRRTKMAVRKIRKVEKALNQNKPAKIIVATAVDVIAASHPTIGTLVVAYKMSKMVYRIANEGYKEYKKTGDTKAALKEAGKETMKQSISVAKEHIISKTVDVGWEATKRIGGINTNEIEDRILTAAAKNVLKEASAA